MTDVVSNTSPRGEGIGGPECGFDHFNDGVKPVDVPICSLWWGTPDGGFVRVNPTNPLPVQLSNVGFVNAEVISVSPGWAETNLGKRINNTAGNADLGVAALHVRRDSIMNPVVIIDGRYCERPVDKFGAAYVKPHLSGKKTGSASFSFAVPSAATDSIIIEGPASGRIYITKIRISGIQTTAGIVFFQLLRRSSNTSDTGATIATLVTHDAAESVSGTAKIKYYTTNPTIPVGSLVGSIRSAYHFIPAAGTATPCPPLEWEFGAVSKALTLISTGQGICVNLNGATYAGLTLAVDVEYSWDN